MQILLIIFKRILRDDIYCISLKKQFKYNISDEIDDMNKMCHTIIIMNILIINKFIISAF